MSAKSGLPALHRSLTSDFLSALPPTVTLTPGLDHEAFIKSLAADFVEALS
jgi:hypothetical protein